MTDAQWEILSAETWLNMEQVAKCAGVCREAVRMAVKHGRLRAIQCMENGGRGRSTLVAESDALRWSAQRRPRGPRSASSRR